MKIKINYKTKLINNLIKESTINKYKRLNFKLLIFKYKMTKMLNFNLIKMQDHKQENHNNE
jgi:hypothetical protein